MKHGILTFPLMSIVWLCVPESFEFILLSNVKTHIEFDYLLN